VELDSVQLRRTGNYPARFEAVISLDGKPVEIDVELYTGAAAYLSCAGGGGRRL